jgi:hypothetical protein
MAVIVKSLSPHGLIQKISTTIGNGSVSEWLPDDEAITLRDQSLFREGAFIGRVEEELVIFEFGGREDDIVEHDIYIQYHVQLLAMLLEDFADEWETATVSSGPLDVDRARLTTSLRMGKVN